MIISLQGVLLNGTTGNATQKQVPISIGQGESLTVNVAVVGTNAAKVDLTGYGAAMRVERRDGTELVHRLGTLVSAEDGTAQLKILSSETKSWAKQVAAWGLWITDPDNESHPLILRSDFTVEDKAMDVDGEGSTPGPDMLLVGVPQPTADDVTNNRVLGVTSISPLTLAWVAKA
jgi:hypothetical protein